MLGLLSSAAAQRTERHFQPVPGQREFTGKMIVRPVQAGPERTEARGRRLRKLAARQLGSLQVLKYVPQTDEYIVRVPQGQTENQLAQALMRSGAFQYVEPDWLLYPNPVQSIQQRSPVDGGHTGQHSFPKPPNSICPDDPLFSSQYHHQANIMQSCDGWAFTTGLANVSIGICDTGLRTTHEDLQLHRLEGFNATTMLWESQGGQIGAIHPHGTWTTGTAAANGNNGIGVVGVGWNLKHRMLRVSDSLTGASSLSTLQTAARTSIESGDRVASVSYSGVSSSSNQSTATYIKSIGGLLVWAAGNSALQLTLSDRDADDLLVVGATGSTDALAGFSNYGRFVDLVAPGVNILTTDPGADNSYAAVSGTSFACPLTAGLCALLWSFDPALTPDEVESIIKLGAEDLGSLGIDDRFGYGRINVKNSLEILMGVSPSADFDANPVTGISPLSVAFQDLSAGRPSSWSWDFGDGTLSNQQNPTHVYNLPGQHSVSLTVSNADGQSSITKTDFITVDTPQLDFLASTTQGSPALLVDFSDLTQGPMLQSWLWDFGDGQSSTAQNPSHIYASDGAFSVSLTVSNPYGTSTLQKPYYIVVGEGYLLSKNSDFSTNDTTFTRSDVLYMMMWSDQVDAFSLTRNKWDMTDPINCNAKGTYIYRSGLYTTFFPFIALPSAATDWVWSSRIQDAAGNKFKPVTNITVNP